MKSPHCRLTQCELKHMFSYNFQQKDFRIRISLPPDHQLKQAKYVVCVCLHCTLCNMECIALLYHYCNFVCNIGPIVLVYSYISC